MEAILYSEVLIFGWWNKVIVIFMFPVTYKFATLIVYGFHITKFKRIGVTLNKNCFWRGGCGRTKGWPQAFGVSGVLVGKRAVRVFGGAESSINCLLIRLRNSFSGSSWNGPVPRTGNGSGFLAGNQLKVWSKMENSTNSSGNGLGRRSSFTG